MAVLGVNPILSYNFPAKEQQQAGDTLTPQSRRHSFRISACRGSLRVLGEQSQEIIKTSKRYKEYSSCVALRIPEEDHMDEHVCAHTGHVAISPECL